MRCLRRRETRCRGWLVGRLAQRSSRLPLRAATCCFQIQFYRIAQFRIPPENEAHVARSREMCGVSLTSVVVYGGCLSLLWLSLSHSEL